MSCDLSVDAEVRLNSSKVKLNDILVWLHNALFDHGLQRYLLSPLTTHSLTYLQLPFSVSDCHTLLAKRLQYAVSGLGKGRQLELQRILADESVPAPSRAPIPSDHGLFGQVILHNNQNSS